jgi:hypothetical protein
MVAIANRYYKLAMAYGGCEIWEEFVLRHMHEQRGIESPSIAETASLLLGEIVQVSRYAENPLFC